MVKQCGLGGFRRGATAEPFRAIRPYRQAKLIT